MTPILLLAAALNTIGHDNASQPPPKLILVTQAAGFVHDVVKRDNGPSRVERTFDELARRTGLFTVDWTDDARTLTPDRIRDARLIVFYTTGDLPLSEGQYDEIEHWLNEGGGFLGIHCATDTLINHPRYPHVIGATFDGHPWNHDRSEEHTSELQSPCN